MLLRKPPRLHPGDVIGVVSPAAAVQAEALRRGCDTLEQLGFTVRVGEHALDRHRFLAGSDADRAAELTSLFLDPTVHAIFCARAGYGSGRLLPLLNLSVLTHRPKIFLGFSDVTFLLNAIVQTTGMACFHGPLVAGQFASGLSRPSLNHLLSLFMDDSSREILSFSHSLSEGQAEGRLVGGCLSILVATLGTPFSIQTDGAVLFIEDTGERPYRVDRMLMQLKQAGKLEHLAGVIFGEMHECHEPANDPSLLMAVLADIFADYAYPVGFGLPSGHGGENFTLPLGIQVRLDTVCRTLTFLEAAVE